MNKEEKRILHGLYYNREMVGEEQMYTANELKWFARNPFRKAKEWQCEDGKLKSVEDKVEDRLASKNAVSAASTRPITYLKEGGYISSRNDGKCFHIALTVKGADLARELDTPSGRLNVYYKDHKDGLLDLLVTVAVSIITTILTNKYLT